ncbi:MAG TPA: hypothetical protein VMF62_13540 [Acetobacteraceae bacterium]|jgi:hypothetical protein|nr:hypothetical protein [Acetobacteraceae bacterium]
MLTRGRWGFARVSVRFCSGVALAACLAGLPGTGVRLARADDQLRTLVVSGDWTATEQQDASGAARDVCVAFTAESDKGFGLRASTADIEVRYSQDNWVLPDDVKGTLAIDVGAYHSVLPVTANTRDTAIAAITDEQLRGMIAAMERARSMSVTAGYAAPETVSLRGSNRATDAFLSCARRIGAAG